MRPTTSEDDEKQERPWELCARGGWEDYEAARARLFQRLSEDSEAARVEAARRPPQGGSS